MRLTLAFATAAAAVASFAPSAGATCMPLWDRGAFYAYTCSAPGRTPSTTICHRPTGTCVSY